VDIHYTPPLSSNHELDLAFGLDFSSSIGLDLLPPPVACVSLSWSVIVILWLFCLQESNCHFFQFPGCQFRLDIHYTPLSSNLELTVPFCRQVTEGVIYVTVQRASVAEQFLNSPHGAGKLLFIVYFKTYTSSPCCQGVEHFVRRRSVIPQGTHVAECQSTTASYPVLPIP
jgi:hypothetical protein